MSSDPKIHGDASPPKAAKPRRPSRPPTSVEPRSLTPTEVETLRQDLKENYAKMLERMPAGDENDEPPSGAS
jgi:hypothetical protein